MLSVVSISEALWKACVPVMRLSLVIVSRPLMMSCSDIRPSDRAKSMPSLVLFSMRDSPVFSIPCWNRPPFSPSWLMPVNLSTPWVIVLASRSLLTPVPMAGPSVSMTPSKPLRKKPSWFTIVLSVDWEILLTRVSGSSGMLLAAVPAIFPDALGPRNASALVSRPSTLLLSLLSCREPPKADFAPPPMAPQTAPSSTSAVPSSSTE